MNWIIKVIEHEGNYTSVFPEELLNKLDVDVGDTLNFEEIESGFLINKNSA